MENKHFEVWKVIDDGSDTGLRHWKIVDKIEAKKEDIAYEDVVKNLSEFGYTIVSSVFPVVKVKTDKTKIEAFVISPAGKEYRHDDWDETIAPDIVIRKLNKKEK